MISKVVKNYCSEPLDHIENYYLASTDQTQTWHCHHKLEISLQLSKKELIEQNLYFDRPANELIFMTSQEHNALHHIQPSYRAALKGKSKSQETRARISTAMKGKPKSQETRAKLSAAMKGKPKSQETRAKLSAAKKGKSRTPETRAKLSAAMKEVSNRPEVKAKISAAAKDCIGINNGVTNKRVKPDELNNYLTNGWVYGMIKKINKKKE